MEKVSVLHKIRQVKDRLPRQQKLLCEYILSKPVEASTLTISELAKNAGVGVTTVIRMIKKIDLDTYNQLKAQIRNAVFEQDSNSYLVYWDGSADQADSENNLLSMIDFCSEEMRSLKRPDLICQISNGAKLILEAKRVYVLGLRMSVGTSAIMEHTLRNYGIDTYLLSREADCVIDRVFSMGEDDLLICLANSPVAKTTADAVRVCSRLGRRALIITGGLKAELASLATVVIDTNIPRRPTTIPATMLVVELISMEIARFLEENGQTSPKDYLKKVDRLAVENHIELME